MIPGIKIANHFTIEERTASNLLNCTEIGMCDKGSTFPKNPGNRFPLMRRTPIWVDCDPGHDDVFAFVMPIKL